MRTSARRSAARSGPKTFIFLEPHPNGGLTRTRGVPAVRDVPRSAKPTQRGGSWFDLPRLHIRHHDLIHKICRDMRRRGAGRILIVGSIRVLCRPRSTRFTTKEAFIDSFSWALRNEVLMPGATDTGFP